MQRTNIVKLILSLQIVCCVAIGVAAQKANKEPSPTPTPERPRAIVALLNDARLAAPELGVDTFLKVVESKKISDQVWRREILDEAMRMADEVKYPVRRSRAYYGTGIVDTVSGYLTNAHDQSLDTLSLKARIIKAWLADDKVLARQILFQMGGDLKLKPLRCEDAMGYMVDEIYTTVGAVGKGAFSPKEIADGVRGLFVLPWIENIESPSQIMPVVDLLTGLQSPAVERRLLANAFERAISRNFGDDRSFSHAFYRDGYKVGSFIVAADDPTSLTSAWREFLAKNSGGPRCLDSKPKKGQLPQPISDFNPMFPEKSRFSEDDFGSVEYSGIPQDKLYLNSEMHKKISMLFKTAREKKNLPENNNDKAAQLEWQLKVTDILDALDSWKASAEETDSEVFNQKTVFYRVMIPEVADTELKVVVTRSFMRYLAGSPMQKDSFIEWIYHARWVAAKYPELFKGLEEDFPNPNFKVMLEAKKMLGEPDKAKKSYPQQPPKPGSEPPKP